MGSVGSTMFLTSSSYNHPEENGFPNFDQEKFEELIREKYKEKIR